MIALALAAALSIEPTKAKMPTPFVQFVTEPDCPSVDGEKLFVARFKVDGKVVAVLCQNGSVTLVRSDATAKELASMLQMMIPLKAYDFCDHPVGIEKDERGAVCVGYEVIVKNNEKQP